MRSIYKYEDNHNEEVYAMIDKLRNELREMLSDHGLKMD